MRLRTFALLACLAPSLALAQELRSPPGLQSGSSGDVSGMSVTPSSSAATSTLARLLAPSVSFPLGVAALPTCTPGSSIAPVPTGQPFACGGLILIAQ